MTRFTSVFGRKCTLAFFSLNIATHAFAFSTEVAVAPQGDLKLTEQAIRAAKKSLLVNIYEMNSSEVGESLLAQVEAGLEVQILQEGQPVGGVSKAEKALQAKIVQAMENARVRSNRDDHYFVMTSKAGRTTTKRRYRYDHAKYVIVDGKDLLIGSENYSESSHPTASKPGNRGWEVFLESNALAKQFEKTFATDTDLSFGDVTDLLDDSSPAVPELAIMPPLLRTPRSVSLPSNATLEVTSATTILSPDSLAGLVSMLGSAQKSIKLELMTFAPRWGSKPSPLLIALEGAARKGIKIQVLLNDETVFEHGAALSHRTTTTASTNNNHATVKILNQLADSENLDLEARIADIKAMGVSYIHNKGVLIDGQKVLVSSINWDQTSVEKNREAGVLLDSEDANAFFGPVFDADWSVSPTNRKSAPEGR